MHEVADVISTEFRAKYYATVKPDGSTDWYRGLTVWSPNINIFRDPRWGRGQETYGEDPFLTARMGVAFVTGLQGNDPKYLKTVATPKHFAVHSGPESTRHTVDVTASRHDMEDTYFPAFRATVIEGKAESVMCAYNSLNGQPACANTFLLEEHLAPRLGLQRLRRLRLRRDRRRLRRQRPSLRADAGRRRRCLFQSRHGRDLRRLPAPDGDRAHRDRQCREPRSAPRSRSRSGALSPLQRALPSRHVRSEIRRSVLQDHACGQRHRSASQTRAARGARSDRPAQEQRWFPAAEERACEHRRDRSERRRPRRAGRELQRHSVAAGHDSRRNQEALPERESNVRRRNRPRESGAETDSDRSALHRCFVQRARSSRGLFQQHESRRLADAFAHRRDDQFRVGRYRNVAAAAEKLFRALDRRSRSSCNRRLLHRLQRARRLSRLDRRQSYRRRLARASSRFDRDEEDASRARSSVRREDRILSGRAQRGSALHLESSGPSRTRSGRSCAQRRRCDRRDGACPRASKAKR